MTKTLTVPEDVAHNYNAVKDDPRHTQVLEQNNIHHIVANWADMQPLDQKFTASILNTCANNR